jgi:glycosyltransferase involved in cell wall biosynthesis/GNAT superfamily N-acetyltransferase
VKVIHLTTVDSTLWFMLFRQLRAIVEAGGEAVGVSSPGPWEARLSEGGIRHVALASSTRSMSLRSDLRAARELWHILRSERPDILHTHNPKPGLYGRVLGRLAGVPVVINTVHGLYATERDSAAKRALVYGLEAIASRFSDLELVQSAEDLQFLTRWRLSRPHRTRFLGNGVDLRRFDPERFPVGFGAAKKAELGIGDDVVVVGIVARLVAEKGYPELLAAMERLGPNYLLLAAGPEDPQKKDTLNRQSLAREGVLFLGHRDDVDELYPAMDMFVLPSHREGFPRAAMEAASSGLPIVATDVRGCREVVDNGISGLLVPVLDPEALAMAIAQLGNDPGLRKSMGRAGRAKALAEFDEEQLVARVIAAYRRAARHKGPAAMWPPSGPCGEVTIRDYMPSDRRVLRRLLAKEPSPRSRLGPTTMWIVAEDRAGPAGVARAVGEGHGGARLVGVFVAPDARGGGVGRLLLSSLLDRLARSGATEVVAEATDHPTSALLRSVGFIPDGTGRWVSRLGLAPA